jgi:DNA-binding NarL/FixJ family response regulator
VRILIAGGTAVSRRAIVTLLRTKPELDIVGDAATIEEFADQASLQQPDLVLINGVRWVGSIDEVATFLQDIDSKPSLLILSAQDSARESILTDGADMFVLKGDPPKSLLTAVETIRYRRQNV